MEIILKNEAKFFLLGEMNDLKSHFTLFIEWPSNMSDF